MGMIKKKINIAKNIHTRNKTMEEFHEEYDKFTNEYLETRIQDFIQCVVDREGNSSIKPCQLQFYVIKHLTNLDDIFDNWETLM
jgi:5-methylcytosine-specific restriction endonuclease McrBC regulatory subunit McrC